MKAVDLSTAQAWCAEHGFAIGEFGLPALRGADGLKEFAIPEDAGKRVALVRGHMRRFEKEEEVCIWLDDWDVWQSGQRWHIFERFRLSYGVGESIMQRPCHLIQKEEFDTAISIAVFAVLMLADCHILGSSGGVYTFYSHDEWGKNWANQTPHPTTL
ncbi:MAG: hypothetical protein IPL39_08395 [Opitutaceae bacterium]|nr:hypothetical protein [Opitutaceae bacterium]